VLGGAGDDSIQSGYGNDTVHGGDGDDRFRDGDGSDSFDGGAGDDDLRWVGYDESAGAASQASDTFTGGAGRDTFWLHGSDVRYDTLGFRIDRITDFQAGDGGDVLDVSNLTNHFSNWDGNTNPFSTGFMRAVEDADGGDTVLEVDYDGPTGTAGWTSFLRLDGVLPGQLNFSNFSNGFGPRGVVRTGDLFSETIGGSNSADSLEGGGGNDYLQGFADRDTLLGGVGDDSLYGGYEADSLVGGDGNDFIQDRDGFANTVLGGAGEDQFDANGLIDGGAGADWFRNLSQTRPATR
jgi:Ca2+-binding RTX toxin-like protein